MHRADILLALVGQQEAPSTINATTTRGAKSSLNLTQSGLTHSTIDQLGGALDPVMELRAGVLTAARNGDLLEVARILSIIDDAEEDTI